MNDEQRTVKFNNHEPLSSTGSLSANIIDMSVFAHLEIRKIQLLYATRKMFLHSTRPYLKKTNKKPFP